VDRDSADVIVEQFALAGVDACPDLDPKISASARNDSAQRMACVGTVERREVTIAGALHHVPPKRCTRSP